VYKDKPLPAPNCPLSHGTSATKLGLDHSRQDFVGASPSEHLYHPIQS